MQSSYQSTGMSKFLREEIDYKLSFLDISALAIASDPSTRTHW